MSTPKYELTTLADVFNKVPSDRIPDCLRELGTLMATTKVTAELMINMAKTDGRLPADATVESSGFAFDFPLTWVDDGREHLATVFKCSNGETLGTIEISKAKKGGAA